MALCLQDPSRLLDVCRQTIVFDRLEDLIACLRIISSDGEVQVLRIKNRMDPAYDARDSGYRDVAMNLRLRSADAQRLGVDMHVCELQLLLLSLAQLKVCPLFARRLSCWKRRLKGVVTEIIAFLGWKFMTG